MIEALESSQHKSTAAVFSSCHILAALIAVCGIVVGTVIMTTPVKDPNLAMIQVIFGAALCFYHLAMSTHLLAVAAMVRYAAATAEAASRAAGRSIV